MTQTCTSVFGEKLKTFCKMDQDRTRTSVVGIKITADAHVTNLYMNMADIWKPECIKRRQKKTNIFNLVIVPHRSGTTKKWEWDSSHWSSPRISLVKGERYVRELKKTQSWHDQTYKKSCTERRLTITCGAIAKEWIFNNTCEIMLG